MRLSLLYEDEIKINNPDNMKTTLGTPFEGLFSGRFISFPSCFANLIVRAREAKCKVFIMKISFHSYENKTNCYMKNIVLSVAFIMRFTATRKWPIAQFLITEE